jgi:hypothetical protein
MLLEPPDDEDKLYKKVSGRGLEGLRKWKEAMTYQVMVIDMPPICRRLRLLLLTTLPPPEDPAVALIVGVYHLYERVNGRKEVGQQHMVSGRPESGDELLVAPDCETQPAEIFAAPKGHKRVSQTEWVRKGQEGLGRLMYLQRAC